MKPPFITSTPAQCRCFHLLRLAQMVWLEHTGTAMSYSSARAQAVAALDLTPQDGAYGITVHELIAGLREAALEARGIAGAVAPRQAIPPSDTSAETV